MKNLENNFSEKQLKGLVEKELQEMYKEKYDEIEKLRGASLKGVDSPLYTEYLETVVKMEESRGDREIRERMENDIQPFIEKKIHENSLNLCAFGNHDHLGFENDEFWGHYISSGKGGLIISVYQKKDLRGDPMDITGKRGPQKDIFLRLDPEEKVLLVKKLKNELERWDKIKKQDDYEYHDWDERTIDGIKNAIDDLSD